MKVRQAKETDLQKILDIYSYAREFMKATGNPNQWKDNRPSLKTIESHLDKKETYIIYDENKTYGVFVLVFGVDPTYINIEGQWLNDDPYVTIHGLAANKDCHGIFDIAINYAKAKCKNVRIDTHKDNLIMQHLIQKAGFQYTGIIYVDDGTPRLAYQWVDNRISVPDKKLYIVDYDGTIISSMELWSNMCSTFIKDSGFVLKEDIDRISINQTTVETAIYIRNHYFLDKTIEEMLDILNKYCIDQYIKQPVKKNAIAMLKYMKERGRIVLFSATAMPLLMASIHQWGLEEYFDYIYSASEMGVTKKDGLGYLEVLKRENIEKNDSIVVEDAIHAVLGAKLVDLEVLGVEDSFNQRQLASVFMNSDYFIRLK